jgi:hypothetical protein
VKIDFAGKPALGQQLESPVDGGVTDARIALLDDVVEVFSAEVIARLKKDFENAITLCALFEPLLAEMPREDPLRFGGQVSARGLSVVNALLE